MYATLPHISNFNFLFSLIFSFVGRKKTYWTYKTIAILWREVWSAQITKSPHAITVGKAVAPNELFGILAPRIVGLNGTYRD